MFGLCSATDSASSCQGTDGCAMMIGMSGKSAATSSRWIGLAYLMRSPPPPRHAGADAGLAGMEQRRQLRLRDHLVERIDVVVVREEALDDRMELEAAHAEILDQAPRLAHAHLAARRIDAGERDRDVLVLVRRLGDLLVRDALDAHAALVVHREHDERHLALAVVGGHLRDGRVLDLVAEIAAARFQRFLLRFVGQHARRGLGMRVDVDGDQVLQVHVFLMPKPQ